jgi:hypothetical protein
MPDHFFNKATLRQFTLNALQSWNCDISPWACASAFTKLQRDKPADLENQTREAIRRVKFDALPPSLCYGATSLPAILDKAFKREL